LKQAKTVFGKFGMHPLLKEYQAHPAMVTHELL
jgi:hypothetical protein